MSIERKFANENFIIGHHVPRVILFDVSFIRCHWIELIIGVFEVDVDGHFAEITVEAAIGCGTHVDSMGTGRLVGLYCPATECSALSMPSKFLTYTCFV